MLNKACGKNLKVEMDPTLDRKLDQYEVWASGTEIPHFKPETKVFDWFKEILREDENQNEN